MIGRSGVVAKVVSNEAEISGGLLALTPGFQAETKVESLSKTPEDTENDVTKETRKKELLALNQERKRQKIEEEKALKKVKEQIEQDRREQKRKQSEIAKSAENPPPETPITNSNITKLNIRLFDGSTIQHSFDTSQTLDAVREWVNSSREDTQPFHFLQTFPYRRFTVSDEHCTLQHLSLLPSATLILKVPLALSDVQPVVGAVSDAYSGGEGLIDRGMKTVSWGADTVTSYIGSFFASHNTNKTN